MAITISSIVQAKMFQELQGQQVLNVVYYQVVGKSPAVTTLNGFAKPLWDKWIAAFAPLQVTLLNYVKMELYEVNGVDFEIFVPTGTVTGTATGELISNFEAVSIQMVRDSRITRHGWKRMAGISEASVSNGTLLTAARTQFQTAAEGLFQNEFTIDDEFAGTNTITLKPIIWGGNSPDYPLGRFTYASEIRIAPRTTTQNTRKVGRGA